MKDPIKPSHYTALDGSGITCADAQRAMLGRDGYIAYLRGMVIKYQWRFLRKDGFKDILKDEECLRMLKEELSSLGVPDANPQVPINTAAVHEQYLEKGEERDLPSASLQDLDRHPSSASRISIWGIDQSIIASSVGDTGQRWDWFEAGSGSGQPGESDLRPPS